MQSYILKVTPGTRFRFGKAQGVYPENESNAQKSTSGIFHSDTLFSALVNAWAICHPETLDMFLDSCRSGKFTTSSGFYHVSDKRKKTDVFFLPKPVCINLHTFREHKKLRKVEFISKGIYEQGILPEEWFEEHGRCILLQNGRLIALKEEIEYSLSIYEIVTSPKVKIRSLNNNREDSFYYQTDLFLLGDANYSVDWYFLTENKLTEDLNRCLQDSLNTMVNMGIGGERSSGCGSLHGIEDAAFDLDVVQPHTMYQMSVSLVIPKEGELSDSDMYKVIKRGGRYLSNGKALPMVQALSEGAVFGGARTGRIVTLNEDPPILRGGLNLSVPIHTDFII